MKGSEIQEGVDYAIEYGWRHKAKAALEKRGVGGFYALVREDDDAHRIEWRERRGRGVHTFRLAEPIKTTKSLGYGDDAGKVPYTIEFAEVRSAKVLGPYDEVMAGIEKAKRDAEEAHERRRRALSAQDRAGEALQTRLDRAGLGDAFEVSWRAQTLDSIRVRCLLDAEAAVDRLVALAEGALTDTERESIETYLGGVPEGEDGGIDTLREKLGLTVPS